MKSVLILVMTLSTIAHASVVPHRTVPFKTVEEDFIVKQKKVLALLQRVNQVDVSAEYYTVGAEYDLEAHVNDYSDKKVVEDFVFMWRKGMTPKMYMFSFFNDVQRPEVIALFNLFVSAKDFDTFFKTAAFAKVHLNEELFIYTFYVAVIHRPDTQFFVLPAPYEVLPKYFYNKDVVNKIARFQMQGKDVNTQDAVAMGVFKEDNVFVFNVNYSSYIMYGNDEYKLSYFTEDIGLNSYYYLYNCYFPVWLSFKDSSYSIFKGARGNIFFFFHQQLLARYYMERLTNGLGEIPQFSWFEPLETGYSPAIQTTFFDFKSRDNFHNAHNKKNFEAIRFLDGVETSFERILQQGYTYVDGIQVNFQKTRSLNYLYDFWTAVNSDKTKFPVQSYDEIARRVLGAAPIVKDNFNFVPTALGFYQTSLRDPMFYQMYNRMVQYMTQSMKFFTPHTPRDLHFNGVKINDVIVGQLVTFFEMFDVDASNAVYFNHDEVKSFETVYKIRQPRLNNKPFNITIDVHSVAETSAVVKIFIGPEFDGVGNPISLKDNWYNFVQLDWFKTKLLQGNNRIVRRSVDILQLDDDFLAINELHHMLDQNKVPEDMVKGLNFLPRRLLLPRGTKNGFPIQLFVFIFQGEDISEDLSLWAHLIHDTNPLGFPFDRPIQEDNFKEMNMLFKNVKIYHEREMYPNIYNIPYYFSNKV